MGGEMAEQGFESLKVWQKAHQMMLDIHKKLVPLLPKDEKYNLADQIRRSSKSVGANIARVTGVFITWTMSDFVTMHVVLRTRPPTI
jgi:hypothetical protein